LPYRNGSNKARKEYCFYSCWDIKHLENVMEWQGLIHHLPISPSLSLHPRIHPNTEACSDGLVCASLLSLSLLHVTRVQTPISLHAEPCACTPRHVFPCAPDSLSLCPCHGFIIILLSTRTPVAIYN